MAKKNTVEAAAVEAKPEVKAPVASAPEKAKPVVPEAPKPAAPSDSQRISAIEKKFDALCKLNGISFKVDGDRLLAVR